MAGQTINAALSLMMTATITAGLGWCKEYVCCCRSDNVPERLLAESGVWQLQSVVPSYFCFTCFNFSLQHGYQQLSARAIRPCIRVVAGQSAHPDGCHGHGLRHMHVV
jgi:hypothetical protein